MPLRSLHCFDLVTLFPSFRFGLYRIWFRKKAALQLPPYAGSTWRGAFGKSLRQLSCSWKRKDCQSCDVIQSCAYGVLFEANSQEPGFEAPPRPYVIRPHGEDEARIVVEMILMGDALRFLPQVFCAWELAGREGIGIKRKPCEIDQVLQFVPGKEWGIVYNREGPWRLERSGYLLSEYLDAHSYGTFPSPPWAMVLLSPLRLRKDGKNVGEADWNRAWTHFIIRISLLNTIYHGGAPPEKEHWKQLKTFFQNPGTVQSHLVWHDWDRYSSRQERKVLMGGLMGRIAIEPPLGLESVWWRCWQTASHLHIGKGTSMGLGQIRFESSAGE